MEGLARWDQLCPAGRAIVVVDNSAVAFALRNGFSSNGKAADLMGTRQMTRMVRCARVSAQRGAALSQEPAEVDGAAARLAGAAARRGKAANVSF